MSTIAAKTSETPARKVAKRPGGVVKRAAGTAKRASGLSKRAAGPAKRPASLASRLAVALEADIVSGKLRPGTRLDEQALARRFKASRTPVREALRQLESRGMVENRPRQGAQVMQLSLASLIEMFETMAWLEAACASLAARRHTQADRDAIQVAHDACVSAQQSLDPEAFYRANARWHEALYAASQNRYLEQETLLLRNRLEPYRRATTFHEGLMALSVQEHQRIADAIFAMDESRAMSEMRGHLDTLRNDAVRTYGALLRVD
ncbi:MAG: GntR family transcriptional regulator [Betaproteobacteria bacterium]|nr:GntR family transcriptional regulator [Betaproteobacteria bacterium]